MKPGGGRDSFLAFLDRFPAGCSSSFKAWAAARVPFSTASAIACFILPSKVKVGSSFIKSSRPKPCLKLPNTRCLSQVMSHPNKMNQNNCIIKTIFTIDIGKNYMVSRGPNWVSMSSDATAEWLHPQRASQSNRQVLYPPSPLNLLSKIVRKVDISINYKCLLIMRTFLRFLSAFSATFCITWCSLARASSLFKAFFAVDFKKLYLTILI